MWFVWSEQCRKISASCLLPGGYDRLYPGLNQSQDSLSQSHSLTACWQEKVNDQTSVNLLLLYSYTHRTPFDPRTLKELGKRVSLEVVSKPGIWFSGSEKAMWIQRYHWIQYGLTEQLLYTVASSMTYLNVTLRNSMGRWARIHVKGMTEGLRVQITAVQQSTVAYIPYILSISASPYPHVYKNWTSNAPTIFPCCWSLSCFLTNLVYRLVQMRSKKGAEWATLNIWV